MGDDQDAVTALTAALPHLTEAYPSGNALTNEVAGMLASLSDEDRK